jgi:5,5'-dehydrodivanillate O-demethylase
MRSVICQDHMAWETQGPIADRTNEHLSYSDRGVAMLRKLLKENIDRVEQGLDPLGVIRDPAQADVDTGLSASIVTEVAWMRERGMLDAAGRA